MKLQTLKIWFLVAITPVFMAIITRFIWELVVNFSISGLIMSILVTIALIGVWALLYYLAFKPELKILNSLPIWIAGAVMATGGVVGAVLHFMRFLPSPECELPWSLVIALLYFIALLNAYSILLWHVWSLWKKKRRKE
ncbi:MAG: hypothetical protein AMJ70_01230 [Dehalococcoidia bacterium SG8_51_3]|nr:MAG: hypothetical protein AMJ70_01230 [Dehalococcoidia bacterium SG8_51_3]